VYKKFGLCRNMFRQLALEGKIPGIEKQVGKIKEVKVMP
jgi:ribosomal protein S14